MKGLTDIPGIRVGHASNYEALTGCTVVLCEGGAVAGVDVRGSATGSQELDVLSPLHLTPHVHGICLAGGSAFGLEAASGVRRYLERRRVGFDMQSARVPIVPSAILYDLGIGKADVRPTREMGEAAAEAATSNAVKEGCVGAGTGATVGKLFGLKQAMKSGIGVYTIELPNGVLVSSLTAVNAFGDVVDPATARIVAGARRSPDSEEFVNSAETLKHRTREAARGGNTTLAVVATNARLTKVQATKLAQLGQQGLVRSISPVHTVGDGDIVFALSVGELTADFTGLGVAAAECVSHAVVRAVKAAVTMGGVPGLGERL
jgi:L-aminopeptidase/D-esterase-like protein